MPVTDPNTMSAAFTEAVNTGNLNALLDLYDPDVQYVTRSGQVAEGRDVVRAIFERMVRANGRIEIDNVHCIVNGDLALVRAHWRYTVTGPDGKPTESSGDSSEVLRRGPDGLWRYFIDHPLGADRQ